MRPFSRILGKTHSTPLPSFPPNPETHEAKYLDIHTAEGMVVVHLDEAAFDAIKLFTTGLRLTCGEAQVTWTAVDKPSNPVVDPQRGWLIPLTKQTRAEIQYLNHGAHELETMSLGLIID